MVSWSVLITVRSLSPSHTLFFLFSSWHRRLDKCLLACQSHVPGIPRSSIFLLEGQHLASLSPSFIWSSSVSFALACNQHKVEGDICRMSSSSLPQLPQCRGLFTVSRSQAETLNTIYIQHSLIKMSFGSSGVEGLKWTLIKQLIFQCSEEHETICSQYTVHHFVCAFKQSCLCELNESIKSYVLLKAWLLYINEFLFFFSFY